MWRDEIQAWNIVLNSISFSDLFTNIQYEGHPSLWFILLWLFSKFTTSVLALQWVNGFISCAVCFYIVFRSPFKIHEKILIVSSYFILYEYAVISRNYMISVLIILMIANWWRNIQHNVIKIYLSLFFLFHTNAFAFLVAIAISFGLFIEVIYYQKNHSKWSNLFGGLIILLGILSSYLLTIPPKDGSYAAGWFLVYDINAIVLSLRGIYRGLFPLPQFVYNFWNTSFINSTPLSAIIGAGTLIYLIYGIRKDKVIFIISIFASILITIFTYVKFSGHIRHLGYYSVIILFVYYLYLSKNINDKSLSRTLFSLVFLLQDIAGLYSSFMDIKYPFSMAYYTAKYVSEYYSTDIQIASSYNDTATPLAGYLKKDIFFLNTNCRGKYVIWNRKHWNYNNYLLSDSLLIHNFIQYQKKYPNSLLIMSFRPQEAPFPNEGQVRITSTIWGKCQIKTKKTFYSSIIDENYAITEIKLVPK
jgi:hypothetical protein